MGCCVYLFQSTQPERSVPSVCAGSLIWHRSPLLIQSNQEAFLVASKMVFAARHPCCPWISTTPRPGVEIALSSHCSLLQQAHLGLSTPALTLFQQRCILRLFLSCASSILYSRGTLKTSNTICLSVSDIKMSVWLVSWNFMSPCWLVTTSLLQSREALTWALKYSWEKRNGTIFKKCNLLEKGSNIKGGKNEVLWMPSRCMYQK